MEDETIKLHERDILILTLEIRKLEKVLKSKKDEIEKLRNYNREILRRDRYCV